MPEYVQWKNQQMNTELARAFREIITAGWANKSDGNVEAPTGHFALVTIEPNELRELVAAVWGDEKAPTIYPGAYVVCEDNYGNTQLIEYLTNQRAEAAFEIMSKMYANFLDNHGAEF